ncbi:MAG: SGNH/GDSL hydrolase family protein [Chloroflexi bacterium]|nr:SGNH/GDSL hydrolase family protein [Chloroflexota bacterium]
MNNSMHSVYRVALPLVGLLLLLVVSLSLNVILVKRFRHVYRELSRVTLNPLGLDQFRAAADAGTEARDGRLVLFYGDSRAAAWPVPPEVGAFVFVNRGLDGQTAVQSNLRYETHAAPVQPDVVVVQVGINDLRVIPALPAEQAAIVAATTGNIRQIVAKAAADGAVVVLTTIFPVQTPPLLERMYWSAEVETAVQTVNDALRTLAADNVIILDAHALLADDNGALRDEYAADYLHLNAAGYHRLNEALTTLLAELYLTR